MRKMSDAVSNENERKASLIYTNPHTHERFNDQKIKYSFSDVARLLSRFTQNDVSLITTMPSGLGLDFHAEKDGSIWVEFYGDVIKSTFVNLATAQKNLERGFTSTISKPVRKNFSDLVEKWEY
jgi:hypothetical protein